MYNIKINNKQIFAFSDSHGTHRALRVPNGIDIIICAGDVVEDDLKGGEYDDFVAWYAMQPAKWKIFVPGNHELSFELGCSDAVAQKMLANGITILQNSVVECDGIVIGSIDSGAIIAREDIPIDLDILVTHCPPYGFLDEERGSVEILNFIIHSQPSYHLFGHIHSTAGKVILFGKTCCKNIACVKE